MFDGPVMVCLERIAKKKHAVPTLSDRIWLISSPLGAFSLSDAEYIEKAVKNLLVVTVDQLTRKIESLHQDARRLSYTLYGMQASLEGLNEVTTLDSQSIDLIPLLLPFRFLNHHNAPTTRSLKDISEDYSVSLQSMKDNTAALNQMTSELNGLRDQVVIARPMFKDHSIETIIGLFKKSGQRVKGELKRIEDEERPQSIMLF